ncbi:MAG: hypothetical protein C4346_19160 [Chloroflexota bacterium]
MKRVLLAVSGFLACPCHLPLWLSVLGGTALGGVLADHRGLMVAAMSAYFVVALAILLWPQHGGKEATPAARARHASGTRAPTASGKWISVRR